METRGKLCVESIRQAKSEKANGTFKTLSYVVNPGGIQINLGKHGQDLRRVNW